MEKLDENSTLKAVMENEKGLALLKKHLGEETLRHPMVSLLKNKKLREIRAMAPNDEMREGFDRILAELKQL